MGKVVEIIDMSTFNNIVDKAEKYIEKEEHKAEDIANSASFNLVWMARKYDDWFLDPIVGFIIPGFGDLLSSVATLPAVYVAAVKIRSFRLTLAIIATMLLDLIVGCIPVAGDLVDAFYKSSKIASRLIVGYVEEDEDTIREINKRAAWGAIALAVIGLLLWLMYTTVMAIYHWFANLF